MNGSEHAYMYVHDVRATFIDFVYRSDEVLMAVTILQGSR